MIRQPRCQAVLPESLMTKTITSGKQVFNSIWLNQTAVAQVAPLSQLQSVATCHVF